MAAIAAPVASAAAAPTQAFPDQMQAPAPARAPMSMIPSMPRLSTPARSVISSPRQAKRMAVPAATAAASTETMNAGVRISVMRAERGEQMSGDGTRGGEGVGGMERRPHHPVTLVMRYRVRMSPPRRKKRMVPWSMGAMAAGKPSDIWI